MADKNEVSLLLVGTGGYGRVYLNELTAAREDGDAAGHHMPYRIAGAVEIAPAARAEAAERGIPLFDSLDDFYASNRADLAIISTPIYLHCGQILQCLASGSNVLCEKPLCATVEEARQIERAEKGSGLFVCVGYQMSFSRAIGELKSDAAGGLFGLPVLLKAIVHYPRNEAYYARNNWAGRIFTADGRPVNDSPLHNAVAHHFNNMLYIVGDAPDKAAFPVSVQAELYRGNPDIENFDTAALRCRVTTGLGKGGADILFYTTHCLARAESFGPVCQYRFERATVAHIDEREHETFYAMFDDGRTKQYTPCDAGQTQKLWDCIEAARGGPRPPSGVRAAIPEVIFANAAQISHPVTQIPEASVRRAGEPGTRYTDIEGLEKTLLKCFEQNLLPSELEDGERPAWASAGKIVDITEF